MPAVDIALRFIVLTPHCSCIFPATLRPSFMALLHIPLDQIDEARLQALIDDGAAESRTIDYKRTIYGTADSDYSEFLADTSSFANTSGGDLVLGMDATNGIPTAFAPLTSPLDPEILRLEQIVRGGLQPRIANIAFQPVPIQAGGNVLIIRVPRSYNAPHRIIRQNRNRFYARSAAGKYGAGRQRTSGALRCRPPARGPRPQLPPRPHRQDRRRAGPDSADVPERPCPSRRSAFRFRCECGASPE